MGSSVSKEYRSLVDRKQKLKSELHSLPLGYISKKAIKGNVQYYLQKRDGTRIVSSYIKNDEVESVISKIEKRKRIIEDLTLIDKRIEQLEQASKLIDKNLYCHLTLYKLSAGMDNLLAKEKEACSSFAHTMNAVEGVSVSKETADAIKKWKHGNVSFLEVFENTLKRYGFPTGAK